MFPLPSILNIIFTTIIILDHLHQGFHNNHLHQPFTSSASSSYHPSPSSPQTNPLLFLSLPQPSSLPLLPLSLAALPLPLAVPYFPFPHSPHPNQNHLTPHPRTAQKHHQTRTRAPARKPQPTHPQTQYAPLEPATHISLETLNHQYHHYRLPPSSRRISTKTTTNGRPNNPINPLFPSPSRLPFAPLPCSSLSTTTTPSCQPPPSQDSAFPLLLPRAFLSPLSFLFFDFSLN